MELQTKTLLLSLFLLSTFPLKPTTSHNLPQEPFTKCLSTHSSPSHPISTEIFTPQNSSYSTVLQAYIKNLRFNTSSTPKPLFIITASHESHVQAAIICARTHGLLMKIRSGGHDYEGVSYVADSPFFVLDMNKFRAVDVDIKMETAWVETGALLGEVYYKIFEKSKVHAIPGGVCPTVGVGGHFGGAGYGNMLRKYGLTVDNIVDAKIVDVKGRVLDRSSMGEDLFWAIIGGGGSSFGVVLSYKINLVRVPEVVTVFKVERTLEQNATMIVDRWQHVAYNLPNELFIRITIDVVNKTGNVEEKTIRATFISLFLGDSKTLLTIMNKSFSELGLTKKDCIETSWIQSVLFWTNIPIGTSEKALLARQVTSVPYLKRKSDYVKKIIPTAGLESIWKKMIELKTPTLVFNPYGGKMYEISPSATPFPHRAGNLWKIQYATTWNQDGIDVTNQNIESTRKLFSFMTRFVSKNPRQAFLNYRDLDIGINHNGKGSYLEGRVYGVKYFKGNFKRLVSVKTKVDPDNFFRNEQSIPTFPAHTK